LYDAELQRMPNSKKPVTLLLHFASGGEVKISQQRPTTAAAAATAAAPD
jgi:hypothetical protein